MGEAFTTALVAYFVTVDPLGLVPIFIAITGEAEADERRQIALRGVVVGTVVLLLFVLFGRGLLTGLGIGIPAFRVAGGLFLFVLALEMVFERRGERRGGTAGTIAAEPQTPDIAVFPLGIPLIAGPAAITTTILAAERYARSWPQLLSVAAALLLMMAATYLALLLANRIQRYLGPTMIGVLSRLLGLLLGALAMQYVIDGIRQGFGLG
ncbi:MAG TPA: MarC family protein [Rhodospirillales bacterium]|nr:MarC family protein [Rhodospirillales bacterium]